MPKPEKFGDPLPFCEPAWYQGAPSPYYNEGHRRHRARVRQFCDEEIVPYAEAWIKAGSYPHKELHKKAREARLIRVPPSLGGADDNDSFYELITLDEIARVGGGNILEQLGINSMALPPILSHGSAKLIRDVYQGVCSGEKNVSLAISEPGAGSDVANIQCKAVKDGGFYVVSGFKKWITGGCLADYFTTAVRTGGPGMGGISLLCIDRRLGGVAVRKMPTQFDSAHSTTFVTFTNVRVPADCLIGEENHGFKYLMVNFNHERFVLAVEALRSARVCYAEAFKHALVRKTFGKRLVDHQIVRFKLAEMARMVEALQDFTERIAFAFSSGVPDHELGIQCALLKVQATKTFEHCAREASQIFGGSSIVKEGKGVIVERLYRRVRATAIPGGSEEILLDFAMRQAAKTAARL
ncbi:putative medium-chain specific acyl-CoA dehydrogenase [Diplonema papillatum]|nr:putative medium-chain specific acyl-CoA dehydrogenase [Diplonema papillatum]